MVIQLKDASGTTPATSGRNPRGEANSVKAIITHADARVDRAIHFDDFEASDQDSEKDGHANDNDDVEFSHESEDRTLHVGYIINPRGIERSQADERDEEEDGGQRVNPGKPPTDSLQGHDNCRHNSGESVSI